MANFGKKFYHYRHISKLFISYSLGGLNRFFEFVTPCIIYNLFQINNVKLKIVLL